MAQHARPVQKHERFTIVCAGLLLLTLLTSCGGGSAPTTNSGTNPSPPPAAKTTFQINMGDSPADWMLAFSMNITSMSLTGSNASVAIVSSSMPTEMMHLMGTMQPLAMVAVPQGTWTGASITIASATVMYIDPITKAPVQKTISGPITATVSFTAPITAGSTPMAIGFDLDLTASVTIDGSGNMSFGPVFHVSSGMQGSGNPTDFADGGIQHMMGSVSSVSGTSFVLTCMQAAMSFSFATNSSTVFDGTSMGAMSSCMLLVVDATLQPDGSLLAARVQSMMAAGGVMGGGIVTSITGQPATQLTIAMQNGIGMGMMPSYFAGPITIALNASTLYQIDEDNIDMSALPFTPVFDATHIYAGQSVMPISSTGMMSAGMSGGMMGGSGMMGTITASQLQLEPQGLSGTVATAITSGSRTSFTLTLPSDSAFTALTGATTVTVFQQQGTIVHAASPIASGATVHTFGQIFFDGRQWKMVACRISSF